VVFNVDALMIQ